jgi:methylglutaconyl-CoA hydratase
MDLLSEDRGQARILILNRPAVRNALTPNLQQALLEALETAEVNPSVRTVVLTGSGQAFCSGLDLAELKSISRRSAEENRRDSARLAELLKRIATFPKPVLAAVNGHAVAGGAGLATACDYSVMSEGAKIGYTETRIGFVPALVSVFLLRQVGERRARELLLAARLISAEKAHSIGLVNEVCPAEEVLTRTLEVAAELAANAPTSLTLTKSLLASVPGMSLEDGLRYATELNTLARTTDNLKEGVDAFLEKRDPSWKI